MDPGWSNYGSSVCPFWGLPLDWGKSDPNPGSVGFQDIEQIGPFLTHSGRIGPLQTLARVLPGEGYSGKRDIWVYLP